MDLEQIYALVDYLVDEKLRDINLPQGKRGLRGPRGLDGDRGQDGKDGKSFEWDNHKSEIFDKIKENKLKFEDLSDEEKASLRGPRGQRGKQGVAGPKGEDGKPFSFEDHAKEVEKILLNHKDELKGQKGDQGETGLRGQRGLSGRDGKDFDWNEHKNEIFDRIDANKLTFSELSDEDKKSLQGERGPRGLRGHSGKDFNWDEHKESIFNRIDQNKLTFSKLTDDEKNSLRGERGPRGLKGTTGSDGRDGKDFSWDDHKDEIFNRIDSNKLKFKELSDEQKLELKGERGPRGQRGRAGLDGLSAYEIWLENNEGSELEFLQSLKGKDGKNGINGLNGFNGRNGSDGIDGKDGEDAPVIIDIQLKDLRGRFYFVFFLSDGSRIETKSVEKPAIESIIQNTMICKSGGSGGGATELEIYKDNILLGVADQLDFVGDNITVTYLDGRATISVEHEETCIGIYDEGVEVTDCVKTMDFIGENVEVVSGTVMADWATLSEVTTLAGYEVGDGQNVKVVIGGQDSVAKLGLTKTAVETINQFDIVRLVSNTQVAKGSSNSSNEAKVSGIALNGGNVGDDITFVMFGVVEDAAFTFPLLAKLFLHTDGTLTTTPPTSVGQYVVSIGESLGTGAIFIKIEEPEAIV